MNERIKVEQALHGYSSGHHLLASSYCQLSDKSEKVMSILSDLSGPERVLGFDEYITGYPLEAERLYAFAKTWYAKEMNRPGCVWTHTLLISVDDIAYIDIQALVDKFIRPSEYELDLALYSKSL